MTTDTALHSRIAERLGLSAGELDPDRPLALYGLDSVSSAELLFDLEERLGRQLPEWLLTDHPTVNAIVSALASGDSADGGWPARPIDMDQMRTDAVLPDDVAPVPASAGPARSARRRVLLTGATGFLGAYLLHALLDTADVVSCLVRANSIDNGAEKIRRNLERYGLWREETRGSIEVVTGDISQPRLGLAENVYGGLARDVDVIYHVAAEVNWAATYAELREPNVLGTVELLRLAAAGPATAFHFVSSLSVGYAVTAGVAGATSAAPGIFDERTDATDFLDRLPLGYARSKAVAEALVREAAARGLPATIVRPPLITGDAATGASNTDDLIARLVKGCIAMGAAPDLDWTVDAIPVDYVATAILRLTDRNAGHAFNLANPRPRHWRECVLWMNLFGYPCALVPYDEWRRRLDAASRAPDHPLHALRPFFLRAIAQGATAPELYEDGRRCRIDASLTQAAEAAAGMVCPPLTADLLDRYFSDYVRRGFLTRPSCGVRRDATNARTAHDHDPGASRFRDLLRQHTGDATLDVPRASLTSTGSEHSILGELTAWRHGRQVGLSMWRLDVSQRDTVRQLDVVLKSKPADTEVIEVGQTVADLCDTALGATFRTHRARVGLTDGHRREPALYDMAGGHEELARHMPVCFGTWSDSERGEWGMLLERLDGTALIDATDASAWTSRDRHAALDGLAALHAGWMPLVPALERAPWIGHIPDAASTEAMTDLWTALARHAAPFVSEWAGEDAAARHQHLAESVGDWWPALERVPRTLIHSDCNPRNLAVRREGGRGRLCAYDWELATIGAPPRDVAELLCFILPPEASADELWRLVERHRSTVASLSGQPLDPHVWGAAFRAALSDVMVKRLAFYVMANRVRPQPFLKRVVRTWHRLSGIAHMAYRGAA